MFHGPSPDSCGRTRRGVVIGGRPRSAWENTAATHAGTSRLTSNRANASPIIGARPRAEAHGVTHPTAIDPVTSTSSGPSPAERFQASAVVHVRTGFLAAVTSSGRQTGVVLGASLRT